MCAVIGFYSLSVKELEISLLKQLFIESQIRGKHATGISFNQETISAPVDVKTFMEEFPFDILTGETLFIGHTRYSTSDLNYNQPLYWQNYSIVHNGVITQEDPSKWKEHFGYSCSTRNDSELILKGEVLGYKHPLLEFKNSSIACIVLQENRIRFYRNEFRPLWYFEFEGSFYISSTQDIIKRSFFKVLSLNVTPIKCIPYVDYSISNGVLELIEVKKEFSDKQINLSCSEYYKSLV